MDLMYSTVKMKKYLKMLKTNNQNKNSVFNVIGNQLFFYFLLLLLLGLDIGRVFIGCSIVDHFLLKAKPFKSFLLQSGVNCKYYPETINELNQNQIFYDEIIKTIKINKIKGIIIGYPSNNTNIISSKQIIYIYSKIYIYLIIFIFFSKKKIITNI